jgi:D-amino-acid oxidase
MLDRRRLLLASAAAAASFAPTASFAQVAAPALRLPPLRPGEWLQVPDFDVLDENPFRVGLRPHRAGGVRLEAEPAFDSPQGRKVLIHNYGHGGAGITLSWGSADRVRELVAKALAEEIKLPPERAKVTVLGAGVIGLTVADALKRWRPALTVTVLAKNVEAGGAIAVKDTTSWIAGGQFEPSGIWHDYHDCDRLPVLHDLVRRSHRRIMELKRERRQRLYGIVDRKNYVLAQGSSGGFDHGIPRDVVPRPRQGLLPFRPLAAVAGREYSTWLINPTVMLPKLVADLQAAGARFESRTVATREEVGQLDAHIVVNCLGLAAGALFQDPLVKPIRGQLVVLKNPGELKYMFSGGCSDDPAYMFARQDDIVVGGTYQRNGSVEDLPEESYRTMLARVRKIFEGDVSECRTVTRGRGRCLVPST